MAGRVYFNVTMSLDGFMAPEPVPFEDLFSSDSQDDPKVRRWMAKWSELQAWLFPQRFFRENLKLGEGGEEGLDNDIARATYERTGASVMGKRMFDPASWHGRRRPRSTRPSSSSRTPSVTRGSGLAAPRSTSSTTASSTPSTRPARPPATATYASPAAPRRSWST